MLRAFFRSELHSILSYTEIQRICLVSARNNRRNQITGFMVECGGVFVGCLEGPDLQVLQTLDRIKLDTRHHKVDVFLSNNNSLHRLFGAWSMNMMFLDDPLLWIRSISSMEEYDHFERYSTEPAFAIGVLILAYRHACSTLQVDPSAQDRNSGKIPLMKHMLRR